MTFVCCLFLSKEPPKFKHFFRNLFLFLLFFCAFFFACESSLSLAAFVFLLLSLSFLFLFLFLAKKKGKMKVLLLVFFLVLFNGCLCSEERKNGNDPEYFSAWNLAAKAGVSTGLHLLLFTFFLSLIGSFFKIKETSMWKKHGILVIQEQVCL